MEHNLTTAEKIHGSIGISAPTIAVIIALGISGMLDPYLAYVASLWVIYGLLGMSLDLVWGRGGVLSLGQTAFYGLGGYFGSVVAINFSELTGNSLIWALPTGAACGALSAAVIGYLIFYARTGPLQTTILTYTFTILLWTLSQSFKITIGEAKIGGDNGMANIPGMILDFGEDATTLEPNAMFATVVVISAVIYFAVRLLMSGPFGRVVDCIRIDGEKTELLGYDIRKYQLQNFMIAGAIAGIAGALYAAWSNYLNPSIFSVQEALMVPIYVLVGGAGTLSGAFIGSVLIGGLSFWLGGGAISGQTTLILGLVLIVLVIFLKNGILGALNSLWLRFLPDRNRAVHSIKPVTIDASVVENILADAEVAAGPPKSLETKNATKAFGGVIPVNDVSLKFEPGIPHSVIGPNGAGKSSFLKVCVGMYPPDSGDVLLGGENVSHSPIFQCVAKGLGVKNQKPQVFGELSIFENLWTAAFSMTRDKNKANQIADQILTMLGMHEQGNVEASALSHGQQQWLDIGMVLCLTPRTILFDEPAAGMTNEETRELSHLVRILAKKTTVLVVEHDMEFVRTLDGMVTVLHQGAFFAKGDIVKLRADDRVLDIYLGRRAHVQSI